MMALAPAFIGGDTGYFLAAYELADSGDFPLHPKRAPLYPMFLAGVIAALGPSPEAAVMVQHALGLGTVALVYFIGALAFGRGAGLIAALVSGINGSLLLMEHTVLSEALLTPILLASLLALLLALRSGRPALFVLAGLGLGLAALTRPPAAAFLPLVLVVTILQRRSQPPVSVLRRWHPRLAAAGLVCLGFLLLVGPWTVRNRLVHGLVTTGGGLGSALFARTHRHDTSFTYRDLGDPPPDRRTARIRKRVFELARIHKMGSEMHRALKAEFKLTDTQSDDALRDAAIQVIRQEPERYVRGTLAMFVKLGLGFEKPLRQLWGSRIKPTRTMAWPESLRFAAPVVAEQPDDFDTVNTLVNLYQDSQFSALIGGLFLLGAMASLTAGWRSGAALLPLVVVTQLLLHVALDGPIPRYRHPVEPLITLVAAGGLVVLMTQAQAIWRLRRPSEAPARASVPVPGRLSAPDVP